MSQRKPPVQQPKTRIQENEALIRALRTNQVDAIVGERDIMLVRLRRTEENLESSRDQLRALAARLQSIREEERGGIAREIHDEFGQALTSLQLGLSWIAAKVNSGQEPLQEKIRSLSALVTTMIQSVRRIADELRPGVLDELGLLKSLRWEAREFKSHTGIECRFETNIGTIQCNRAGSVALFRITQAALTNVARHAQASRAVLGLMREKQHLILTVSDNGKGISQKQVSSHNSLGIIGMRERALALDGTLTVTESSGRGTTLKVRIPLSQVLAGRAPARSRKAAQK